MVPILFVVAQIESTLETTIAGAERLAGKDDRVLFLATLILFFIAGGVAVWWFMKQLDKRDARIEAMQKEHAEETSKLHKEIGQIRAEWNQFLIASVGEFRTVLANNTAVINNNTAVIEENKEMSEKKMVLLQSLETLLRATPASAKLIT